MERLALDALLQRFVKTGQLRVIWPDGSHTLYGPGSPPDLRATMGIGDGAVAARLCIHPELTLGEVYMDGGMAPVDCSIYQLLDVLMANQRDADGGRLLERISRFGPHSPRWFEGLNRPERSRRNVAHHYDLDGRLYSLFLDRDRQYSCAYFSTGNETLEEAQDAKKRLIAAKLHLHRPDLSVLDIGCGWGGLALTLARDYGARVTGVTLSREQLLEARARTAAAGLDDRISFELADYRTINRRFDRVVSVGMFEHVGARYYRTFFDTVRRCLDPTGVALLHTIGRPTAPYSTSAWINKYIFPGGYLPSLSEILPALENAGLQVTDVEVLRLHYAETLRHWRRRFAANRDTIASIYDERFCRMWEFYLAGSELAFRHHWVAVFQLQMGGPHADLPTTRDYMLQKTAPRQLFVRPDSMADQTRA